MTIANTTVAAAPTNVANSEQAAIVLFGAHSGSQTSTTFTVDQMPFYLSAFNLGGDDTITVQQVYGSGSGVEVGPFAPVYGVVQLTQKRTKVMVDYPGRYQLLHAGSSALGTFTVTGFAASMTSDPISDIAEALSASLGQFASTSLYNYVDLGTISDGHVNLDFSVNRAYRFVVSAFTDIDGIAFPSQPSWLFIKVTQDNAGSNLVQFADLLSPILTPGTTNVQAAQAANAVTVYTFWWDGTIPTLVGFSSTNGEVGR